MNCTKPLLLLIALFTFAACGEDAPVPKVEESVFIVGLAGGWGGTSSFRVAEGQYFISKERAGAEPNTTELLRDESWELITNAAGFEELLRLQNDFPHALFGPDDQTTACTAAAFDGQCPFVVTEMENGEYGVWTWDSPNTTGSRDVYMRDLERVVLDLLTD